MRPLRELLRSTGRQRPAPSNTKAFESQKFHSSTLIGMIATRPLIPTPLERNFTALAINSDQLPNCRNQLQRIFTPAIRAISAGCAALPYRVPRNFPLPPYTAAMPEQHLSLSHPGQPCRSILPIFAISSQPTNFITVILS